VRRIRAQGAGEVAACDRGAIAAPIAPVLIASVWSVRWCPDWVSRGCCVRNIADAHASENQPRDGAM